MAIKTELFKIDNNRILVKTYSTENLKIRQLETDNVYEEAVDVGYLENGIYKPKNYTYIETEEKIESIEEPKDIEGE